MFTVDIRKSRERGIWKGPLNQTGSEESEDGVEGVREAEGTKRPRESQDTKEPRDPVVKIVRLYKGGKLKAWIS